MYMEIFEKYSDLLEAAITDHLSAAIDGFDLMELVGMLKARKHELDGEVFDMMLTLTDFEAFKELMLAYKAETVQVNAAGLSCKMVIRGYLWHNSLTDCLVCALRLACRAENMTTDRTSRRAGVTATRRTSRGWTWR